MAKQAIEVSSPVGRAKLDSSGSAIGAVRINPESSYSGVSALLKEVINDGSEEAWSKITAKIDNTYDCLCGALEVLDGETAFSKEVKTRVEKGQKILFKPNLVGPVNIERNTHGPGNGSAICTAWPFVAAVMRWFHDKLDISYYRMTIGEAGSAVSATAAAYTRSLNGKGVITTEALIEGRSGDFYGGWGFYFVRKYLAGAHDSSHKDDPMKGYEESISGTYIAPGKANDKLMVYDLNRIDDDRSNGRDVSVANGINFKSITLHKAVVGGDPDDEQDRKDNPGCVLINLPKLKVHDTALLTNAVKNLGIGLYPMEVNISTEQGKKKWKYAFPHQPYPGIKSFIPHSVWVAELDQDTLLPPKDENGNYIVMKTGGLSGTMVNVIDAVKEQDTYIFHIIDAIEATNYTNGVGVPKAVVEGYIFAGEDAVALDVMNARYLFTTVPMVEARKIQSEKNLSTDFLQKVPMPKSDGCNIVTEEGVDEPLTRYPTFQYCQDRGLGQQDYYIVGQDKWQGGELSSIEGHLGRVENNEFSELLTSELYYSVSKPLWDLQAMTLSYAEANDVLTGSAYKQAILDAFDENGDGIIDYDETGKKGWHDFTLCIGATTTHLPSADIGRAGFLKGSFLLSNIRLRCSRKDWNNKGHDFAQDYDVNSAVLTAWKMSKVPAESADPLFPGMTWGKGKWPSIQLARYMNICSLVYGERFPDGFDNASLYGNAFRYADAQWGNSEYTGQKARTETRDLIGRYHQAVAGGAALLPFSIYAPTGFGGMNGSSVPNVIETDDPALIFTAEFNNGSESWRELSILSLL